MHSAFISRRDLLHASTFGIGTVALAYLLDRDRLLAAPAKPELEPRRFDLKPKPPHHPAKAKAMISLFMQGGPSHIDLFDPKPKLTEYDGKAFPGTIKYDNAAQASSKVLGSPWKFARHGQRRGRRVGAAAAHRQGRRRPHDRAVDAHGREQPRPVDLRAQQRPHHGRAPGAGQLDVLRPRLRGAGPARRSSRCRTRRACRCSASTIGPTAGCRRFSRARSSARRSRGSSTSTPRPASRASRRRSC